MARGHTRDKRTDPTNVLPPVAELIEGRSTRLHYVDLDGELRELDYRDIAPSDPYPIPMPVDREGYGAVEHSHRYWATGHGDWMNVREAWRRFGDGRPAARLFDFGCASGRFLRHVCLFDEVEPWGSDFAPANVAWVHQHLPPEIRVLLNTSKARLPFDDGQFDIVTAFSVMTHIDDDEEEWLRELRRITSPRGILYLTIHNEATWDRVSDRPHALSQLMEARRVTGNRIVDRALFLDPMPDDRLVFRMSDSTVYNCNVWHSSRYIRENWGRWFEILLIADNAHTCYQSVVIVRPR